MKPIDFKINNVDLSQWCKAIGLADIDDDVDALRYAIEDIKNVDKYEKYILGIWENEEEKDMNNEVLKLYYNKKREEIIDKYEKKEQEYFAKNDLAKEFNELVEKFEEDLENLYKSVQNFDNDYIVQRYDENNYKYKVNTDKISKEFEEKYITKRQKELKELDSLREEIDAQLSMSDDLDYQIDVLIRYGILDKKTKKMVD